MTYASLLVFLGSHDALQEFGRPDFLHSRFFIHCIQRDECINTLRTYEHFPYEMDIFLPHNAVDLIHIYGSLPNPRRRFHLYCETEEFVHQYRRLALANICDQVFHTNQIEIKLYKIAHAHILHCIVDLEKRSETGDIDADDLLLLMGELFEQSAKIINENIRQKSGLPTQPADSEEE